MCLPLCDRLSFPLPVKGGHVTSPNQEEGEPGKEMALFRYLLDARSYQLSKCASLSFSRFVFIGD